VRQLSHVRDLHSLLPVNMGRTARDVSPSRSRAVSARARSVAIPNGGGKDRDHTTPALTTDRTANHLPNVEQVENTPNTYMVSARSHLNGDNADPLVERYLRGSASGTKLRRAFGLEDMMAHVNINEEEVEIIEHLDWACIEAFCRTSLDQDQEKEKEERQVKKGDVWMRSWKVPSTESMEIQTSDEEKEDPRPKSMDPKEQARPSQASLLLKGTLRSV
jgi:hypothetical protein